MSNLWPTPIPGELNGRWHEWGQSLPLWFWAVPALMATVFHGRFVGYALSVLIRLTLGLGLKWLTFLAKWRRWSQENDTIGAVTSSLPQVSISWWGIFFGGSFFARITSEPPRVGSEDAREEKKKQEIVIQRIRLSSLGLSFPPLASLSSSSSDMQRDEHQRAVVGLRLYRLEVSCVVRNEEHERLFQFGLESVDLAVLTRPRMMALLRSLCNSLWEQNLPKRSHQKRTKKAAPLPIDLIPSFVPKIIVRGVEFKLLSTRSEATRRLSFLTGQTFGSTKTTTGVVAFLETLELILTSDARVRSEEDGPTEDVSNAINEPMVSIRTDIDGVGVDVYKPERNSRKRNNSSLVFLPYSRVDAVAVASPVGAIGKGAPTVSLWANVNEGCPIKTDLDDTETDIGFDGSEGRDRPSDVNARKLRLNLDTMKLALLALEMKGLVPIMLSIKALSQSLLRRKATTTSTAVPNNSPSRQLRSSLASVEGASIKLGLSLTVKDTLQDQKIRCKEEKLREYSPTVDFPDEVSWEKHYPAGNDGIVLPHFYTIVGGSIVSARLVHIRPSGTEQMRRSMSSFGDDEDTFDPLSGIRTVKKKRFTAVELAVRFQGTHLCLEKQRRRRRRRFVQPSGYGVNIVSLDDASVRIVKSIATTVRTETRIDDDYDDDDDDYYDDDEDEDDFDAIREEENSGVVVSVQREVEARIQMDLVGASLSLGCNPEVVTFLGRLLYIASKSRPSPPGRKSLNRKKKARNTVVENVTVALESLGFTYEDLEPFHKYEAFGRSLSLRIRPQPVPPRSTDVRPGKGKAHFQIDSARVAMTFLPHLSLKARNEDDDEEKQRAKRRRVMIDATANDIGGRIAVPASLPPPVEKGSEGGDGLPGGGREVCMIGTSFVDLVINERVGWTNVDKPLDILFGEPKVIVDSPETEVELSEQAVPVNLGECKTDQDASYAIVRTMSIRTTGKTAEVSWSPVFHWFMMSGIKRTQDLAKHCQGIVKLASTGSRSSNHPKPRSVVNVLLNSTSAKVDIRALLGSDTVLDAETKELIVESKLEPSGAWTKPSVRLKVGSTRVRLDECMCDVATFSSVEMRIDVRLAHKKEIEEYWKKARKHELLAVNPRHSHLSNDLVTDNRGRPLKEIVNLTLGKKMSVQFPPDLQFGKVINDLVATPRLLFEGLAMGGVLKPKKGPGKFQLMTINAKIPFATFSMLEYTKSQHHDQELLRRMKVDIIEVGLHIERNTPPQIIQDTLDDLDEDKSCVHTYGPVIQGGIMDVTIGDLVAVIHPVTLVTPSVLVRDLKVSGLFLLAGLRPDTEGLAGGRSVPCPLACHHCCFVDATSRGSASEVTPVLCGCSYEVPLKSTGVPPKVFIDLDVNCREVEASYGILMMAAIPKVLECVQRLTPPPPPLPPDTLPAPPLAWWDNLIYWIHGNVGFMFKSLHVRWLLDTEKLWERSIVFKSNDCCMQSSKGDFKLSASNMILTLPGMSYHLIDHEASKTQLPEAATVPSDRHPLMLIPHLEARFKYEWILSRTSIVSQCDHHSPYMVATKRDCREDALLSGSKYHDQFLKFRTKAIKVKGSATLEKSAEFVNWMALRIDVLPWVTHQNPDVILPLQALKGKENPDAPEPLPTIESITVAVSAGNLYVLSWFYESGESRSVNDDISEAASDGVCLIVPRVRAKVDLFGEKAVDVDGPIQATLLDKMSRFQQESEEAVLLVDTELERYDRMSAFRATANEQGFIEVTNDPPEQRRSQKDDHIQTFFANLQQWSRTVTEYDYLMVIDHVDVFTKALQSIVLTPSDPGEESDRKKEPPVEQEEEARKGEMTFGASSRDANETWTVLVSEMKLLWTLHIRDCVMSIVSDLLYTIDCMRARASTIYTTLVQEEKEQPQNGSETATPRMGDSSRKEIDNDIPDGINEPSSLSDDLDALPAASSHSNETYQFEEVGAAAAAEFNSSLSYLLDSDRGEHHAFATNEAGDLIGTAEAVDSQGAAFAARENKASRAPRGEAVSALFGPDDSETVPSLDIHLSNLQIQLHSESTGGSVVLAMRGAYVEGRHFVRLFVAEYPDPLVETISPTDFLRKSEYQAILDCMEVYWISTDPAAGLQWLETETGPKKSRPRFERDERRLSYLLHPGEPSKERRGMPQFIFPPELHHHQAKDFKIPGCLHKIMSRSTFQTRSVVYRPPAHLSGEQLRQHIREEHIRPLWDLGTSTAHGTLPRELDYTDLFLDELSFHLDAEQFNTTLDLFRNVFLAPKKRPRERQMVEEVKKQKEGPAQRQLPRLMSESVLAPAEQVQALVEDWNGRLARDKGRKMRDALRAAAQALTATLDDRHRAKGLMVVRRVEYTLGTARWHVQSDDVADDVEINFTEFHGLHDFSEDGAVDSHLGLGDIRVVNLTPGPDSKAFYNSSAVLDTAVGAERSPCQRCGRAFERATNHATACVFHSGTFRRSANGSGRWSCCRASSEDAVGCVSRPHSGSERAIDLRLEALPQTVQGITMYKHVEVNFFPSVQHTLVVQVTNGLAGLFNAYFLPEDDDDVSVHTEGACMSASIRKSSSFGHDSKDRGGKDPKPTKSRHASSAPGSPVKDHRDSQQKPRKEEVFFVQYWRVGHMKVVLSFAGFPLVPDTFNLGIAVPEYSKVYKVGGGAYLGRKYVAFLIQEVIKSAASSGFLKVRDLLLGNKADPTALGADPLLVFDGGGGGGGGGVGYAGFGKPISPRRHPARKTIPPELESDHVFVQPSKERIEEARATFFLGSLEKKSRHVKEKRQQAQSRNQREI